MKTVDELLAEARTWIGVPFQHQGRTRYGVDCAGFLEVLARWAGGLPDDYQAPRAYGRRPNGELLETVTRYCRPARAAIPGALVLIQWPREKLPSHVALCTGPNLIHAYMRGRKVVEHGYRGPWLRDTHSAYLLPGVLYE